MPKRQKNTWKPKNLGFFKKIPEGFDDSWSDAALAPLVGKVSNQVPPSRFLELREEILGIVLMLHAELDAMSRPRSSEKAVELGAALEAIEIARGTLRDLHDDSIELVKDAAREAAWNPQSEPRKQAADFGLMRLLNAEDSLEEISGWLRKAISVCKSETRSGRVPHDAVKLAVQDLLDIWMRETGELPALTKPPSRGWDKVSPEMRAVYGLALEFCQLVLAPLAPTHPRYLDPSKPNWLVKYVEEYRSELAKHPDAISRTKLLPK